MGQDKRFLEVGGISLLERSLAVLEELFSEILVVTAEPAPELSKLDHRIVTDLIPNCATLGGLYTGVSLARHPRVFAAACDMPFLNAGVIRGMSNYAPGADVVMARLSYGLQPMHAVYSTRCLSRLEAMAKTKSLRLQDLAEAQDLDVRLVSEETLRPFEPDLLSFMNINSPSDLEFARKLVASRGGSGGGASCSCD